MLASLDRQEADKGNLHAGKGSKGIPGGIADVETVAVAAHANKDKGVKGKDTGDEGITTPRGHHVPVEERAKGAPEHGTKLQRLDPQEEGKDEEENGDSLVVVAACDRSRDVAGGDAHESGGKKASRRRGGHFIRKEVCGEGRQAREGGREEDANVANVDGDGEGLEDVVDDAAGDHETWVEGSPGNPTKRMPCSVVKPIPEFVEAIRNQVFRSSKVEPGVDWMRSAHEGGSRELGGGRTFVDNALKTCWIGQMVSQCVLRGAHVQAIYLGRPSS